MAKESTLKLDNWSKRLLIGIILSYKKKKKNSLHHDSTPSGTELERVLINS